jgi:tripeptidyl-peptidase-1
VLHRRSLVRCVRPTSFASGDSGANCKDNKFEPNWPAASPYVTAVGGTSGTGPERAVGLSSGGFSNRYGTPSWQKAAVQTYLASSTVPSRSLFNASGRGFPDIAAQAVNFVVVSNLIPNPGVAGTSCASPTAAGVIGLLNDLRLQRGKSTLGFLNPFLYGAASSALNDITSGSNTGCGFSDAGFSAVDGWDPVTGVPPTVSRTQWSGSSAARSDRPAGCVPVAQLGTPNYANLAQAVLALP